MSYSLSPLSGNMEAQIICANKLKFSLANRKEGEMVDNFIKHAEFKY